METTTYVGMTPLVALEIPHVVSDYLALAMPSNVIA
jgi:hypothetical protein